MIHYLKSLLRPLKRYLMLLIYAGKNRYCPVCDNAFRKFRDAGALEKRKDAECPSCYSLERHRLQWLFLKNKTHFFDVSKKNILHVAPEPCFRERFAKRFDHHYLTADLLEGRANIQMDIRDIQYPDGFFDVIFCSHVLEHIEEDLLAMSELYRVLSKSGWAILDVPIRDGPTHEDPSIDTPEARLAVFKQTDHVRFYGHDYTDRLREAGFTVKKYFAKDFLSEKEMMRAGLSQCDERVYLCSR